MTVEQQLIEAGLGLMKRGEPTANWSHPQFMAPKPLIGLFTRRSAEPPIPEDRWGDDRTEYFTSQGFTDIQSQGDGNYHMRDGNGNPVTWDHETNRLEGAGLGLMKAAMPFPTVSGGFGNNQEGPKYEPPGPSTSTVKPGELESVNQIQTREGYYAPGGRPNLNQGPMDDFSAAARAHLIGIPATVGSVGSRLMQGGGAVTDWLGVTQNANKQWDDIANETGNIRNNAYVQGFTPSSTRTLDNWVADPKNEIAPITQDIYGLMALPLALRGLKSNKALYGTLGAEVAARARMPRDPDTGKPLTPDQAMNMSMDPDQLKLAMRQIQAKAATLQAGGMQPLLAQTTAYGEIMSKAWRGEKLREVMPGASGSKGFTPDSPQSYTPKPPAQYSNVEGMYESKGMRPRPPQPKPVPYTPSRAPMTKGSADMPFVPKQLRPPAPAAPPVPNPDMAAGTAAGAAAVPDAPALSPMDKGIVTAQGTPQAQPPVAPAAQPPAAAPPVPNAMTPEQVQASRAALAQYGPAGQDVAAGAAAAPSTAPERPPWEPASNAQLAAGAADGAAAAVSPEAPQTPLAEGAADGAQAAVDAAPSAAVADGMAAAAQVPAEPSSLVWEGDVGEDAYQRALQQPMAETDRQALVEAFNGGTIPQEQMPRAMQQLIATDSVNKAMELAQESNVSFEQASGAIGEARSNGQLDNDDTATGISTMVYEEAKKSVEAKTGAPATPEAVDQEKADLEKKPGFIDEIVAMWQGMDWKQQLGLVVGIAGSAMALVNGVMGGNGMTTLIGGALGVGGLGYAFGGYDKIKGMLGFGGEEAAPEGAPEGAAPPAAPPGNAASATSTPQEDFAAANELGIKSPTPGPAPANAAAPGAAPELTFEGAFVDGNIDAEEGKELFDPKRLPEAMKLPDQTIDQMISSYAASDKEFVKDLELIANSDRAAVYLIIEKGMTPEQATWLIKAAKRQQKLGLRLYPQYR